MTEKREYKDEYPDKRLYIPGPTEVREDVIEAMCQHPILIERPVVIRGDRAALGRPPETVLTLLD